jgi:soluble lytic murein transglycosylase-like protein
VADPAKSAVDIAYGMYYLRYLLDEYHGHLTLASAVQPQVD